MRLLTAVLLSCSLGAGSLLAQATASGTLQGTVSDKTGAVVPGASVKFTSKDTGLNREVKTNEAGSYRFDLLPAGSYDVRVAMPGFQTLNYTNVVLAVGQVTTVDASLSPSAQAETVTVEAAATAQVDTQKTEVGLAITPTEVANIPLNGRDFANLAILAPGARPVPSFDATKNRQATFGVNGSSGRNINITINGIDNKDNTVGGTVMQFSLEAVQEFAISTQRFSAANGRSEGAVINVVTKSGTNQFHGSAFGFFRDKALNSLNYFERKENQGPGIKGPFSRQQVGGSIGGPVRKDKDFVFFALEKHRERTSTSVNPVSFAELSRITNLGAQPASVISTPFDEWRYTIRADHRFSDRHNLFASYSDQDNNGLNDQVGQNGELSASNFTTNKMRLANLTLNSVLSPRIVNAFTAGYSYWSNLIDTPARTALTLNFPGNIRSGTNGAVPQGSIQAKWQFRNDISITAGKHTLRTGFDYVHQPRLGGFFVSNSTLTYTFFDVPSRILTDTVRYPQGFASPGAVQQMTISNGDPNFLLRPKMIGVYFQDDWKVSRRLTVNVGIRWDKDINLVGGSRQAESRTYQALRAINHPLAGALPQDYNKAFSPRVGFAWDVTGAGKHVIRGGYGLYYGQTFLNIPLFMIQQANPTLFAQVLSINSRSVGDTASPLVPGTNVRLGNWRFGVDPAPTIAPPRTSFQGGEVGRLIDPNYQPPYTQHWNLGYAYQLSRSDIVEVEYVRSLSLRESKTIPINVQRGTTARELDGAFRAAGLPLLNRIDISSSIGRSFYQGLNVSYRRRMTNRFSINSHYVLSGSGSFNGAAAAFGNRPTNLDQIFANFDYGPSTTDERHRFVFSSLVNLPWGINVAPFLQWASARPFNPTFGINDLLGYGGGAGNMHAVLRRSDPENYTWARSLTTAVATQQALAGLADGSMFIAPFNPLRGVALFQFDLRVSKTIKFGERSRVELMYQGFNLSNRSNFGGNMIVNTRDLNFGKPQGFLSANGVLMPRSYSGEFAARFTF